MAVTAPFVPQVPAAPDSWSRIWAERIANVIKQLVARENCAAELTLTALAASTTMTDFRIHPGCVLSFMPLTANAAAAKPFIYVTNIGKGAATINHGISADTDQDYQVSIVG